MRAQQLAKLTETNTQMNSRQSWTQDPPPHQSSSKDTRTSSIRLVYEGQDLIEGKVYALASDIKNVGPALRSGKDTTRFDPMKRPSDQKGKSTADQSKPTETVPTNHNPQQQQVTPPTNPINRSDGWTASIPSKNPSKSAPEVDMKDGTRKTGTSQSPQYHFTSDIQDLANPQVVYDEIMNQKVTLPVYQVIGSSPALQKLVGEAT